MLGWAIRWACLVFLGALGWHALAPHLSLPAGEGRRPAVAPSPRLLPGQAAPEHGLDADSYGSEVTVPSGPNGHFYVDATVNSTPVRFLIDTGATFVVLSEEVAANLGIRPARHEYTVRMQTANGVVLSAPVTLRQLQVGNFTARDVEALVSEAPMRGSLLGLSFLERLQSYEVRQDRLVLRW